MQLSTRPTEPDDIITCREVHKWYGSFHALRGITTTIRRGEVTVIVGPSGSGKSTLLRTMNRLERHERGDIVVNGTPLTDDLRNIDAVRRDVGIVFQSFNLFSHMTVLKNITLAPTKVHHVPQAQAERDAMQLMTRMEIADQAHKYPEHLSSGQQQRVAIARALAMKPNIMMFDEPTSAIRPRDDPRDPGHHEGIGPLRNDHGDRDPRDSIHPGGGEPRGHARRRTDSGGPAPGGILHPAPAPPGPEIPRTDHASNHPDTRPESGPDHIPQDHLAPEHFREQPEKAGTRDKSKSNRPAVGPNQPNMTKPTAARQRAKGRAYGSHHPEGRSHRNSLPERPCRGRHQRHGLPRRACRKP